MSISVGFDKAKKSNRPNKGRSLIEVPNTYTVIDIETTGLDSSCCKIIELSAFYQFFY